MEKPKLVVLEIDKELSDEEKDEVFNRYSGKTDVAVRFSSERISEFNSVSVIFFDISDFLGLRAKFKNIFPLADFKDRNEDSPISFVDCLVDDMSKKTFDYLLKETFNVDTKILSVEEFPRKVKA